MSCRRRASWMVIAWCLVLCAACGDPPTREMDQAQGAIDAARAARADRYAPDEYQAAVAALQQARDAVAQRDYRLALNHALDSRERAQAAATKAADEQATRRSAAERRLSEVTAMLAHANQRLRAAETARVLRRTLTAPRAAIAAADDTLQKAGAEISDGDYRTGQADLDDTAARLKRVIADLDAMLSARSTRPRR